MTEEQKQAYIDQYYEHEGIRLDPERIEYNPGLRSLAKLMLNSLCGMLYKKHLFLSYSSNPRVNRSNIVREGKILFFIF